MVRYLFYRIGDLTYQSPLVIKSLVRFTVGRNGLGFSWQTNGLRMQEEN